MPELSIVSWNVHWGRGRFTRRGAQPFDVATRVLSYDADVYVLPEHFRDNSGVGLADPLRDAGYTTVELPFVQLSFGTRPRAETPGEGWWELLVASRVPVLDHEVLPIGSVVHDRAGSRAAIRVGLDVRATRVDLVGIHTSSKLWWGGPAVHLRGLRQHLRTLHDGPALIAGDFNLWGPPVEALLPGWKRVVRGRTWPAPFPHSQIDHVLVNEHAFGLAGEVMERTPSDHRAIRARIGVG